MAGYKPYPEPTHSDKRKDFYNESHGGTNMKRKVLEDYHSCVLCSDVFSKLSELRRHEIEHLGNDVISEFKGKQKSVSPIPIEVKPYKYNDEKNDDEKEDTHTRVVVRLSGASKTSSTKSTGDEEEYQCDICEKFTKKYGVELHERMHEKPYHCNFCEKSFSLEDGLKFHMEVSHKEKMPQICKICGKLFPHQLSYENHMKSHTGEWPFECKQCDKCFSSKQSLKMHEFEHKGEMPYQCRECEKGFRTLDALNGHRFVHRVKSSYNVSKRPVHNNKDKGFPCRRCDQVFAVKGKLIEHQMNHQEGKTYYCDHCGEKFWRKRRLTRHENLHCPVLNRSTAGDRFIQRDEWPENGSRKRPLTRQRTLTPQR